MAELNVVVCVAFDHRADAQGLDRFKECISNCSFVDVVMEVSGTFNLIAQGRIDTLAAYTAEMDRIGPQLSEFVTRIETNFVSRKIERAPDAEKIMWVPCAGGRKRVDIGMIDKVTAEGDYMRLYIGDWHCLIHSTISAIKEHLDERFIQLHRSAVVRIDFIDRLMHSNRRWIARLRDGSQQGVAKSHVAEVLDLIAHESPKRKRRRSKLQTATEVGQQPGERQTRLTL